MDEKKLMCNPSQNLSLISAHCTPISFGIIKSKIYKEISLLLIFLRWLSPILDNALTLTLLSLVVAFDNDTNKYFEILQLPELIEHRTFAMVKSYRQKYLLRSSISNSRQFSIQISNKNSLKYDSKIYVKGEWKY